MSKTTENKKTARSKKQPEVAVPEGSSLQNSAQEASEAGSVDKIRDIIFGNQMRDYETRFARLEQRLLKEISDLRDETGKRFDSFELYVNKELESLGERLKAEQDLRAELDKKLSGEIKDASRSLSKNIDRLAEVQSNDSRELRQQLLELNKNISAEIRKKGEESFQALDQTAEELRADKVDRSSLAEILMEIAVRMSDELAEKLNLKTENIKDE
ncbi:MAG: hypothetical protein KJP23_02380 [Deltaproteobacteria bacterium]|nr:hypothetical protein [Deltaproteobacteria bacterium]